MAKPQDLNPSAVSFRPQQYRWKSSTQHTCPTSALDVLPDAILILVFAHLNESVLLRIAAVSQRLRTIVIAFSVRDRLRQLLPRTLYHSTGGLQQDTYKTVKPEFYALPSTVQLLRLESVRSNQEKHRFSVVEEASWKHKAMPVLKADDNKMVLGTGNELWVSTNGSHWSTTILGKSGIGDISDVTLTSVPEEVIVAYVDGRIESVRIAPVSTVYKAHTVSKRHRAESQNSVESVDYFKSRGTLLSVYRHGQIVVNWSNIKLGARPWCTSFIGAGDCTATGTRSNMPLMVHTIRPSGLTLSRCYGTNAVAKTSVFAVSGLSNDLVISGWYDGTTRLFDLRSSSTNPAIAWRAQFDDAAIYSVACSGNTVYAGSALHGLLRVFDLRSTKPNISVFMGTKHERGPIYSLVAEHERVFAATEHAVHGIDYFRINTNPTHTCRNDFIGTGRPVRKVNPHLMGFRTDVADYIEHERQRMCSSLPD